MKHYIHGTIVFSVSRAHQYPDNWVVSMSIFAVRYNNLLPQVVITHTSPSSSIEA